VAEELFQMERPNNWAKFGHGTPSTGEGFAYAAWVRRTYYYSTIYRDRWQDGLTFFGAWNDLKRRRRQS
jgi:hypothetical protein